MPTICLDHQSSTPVLREALEGMMPFFTEAYGTPSSLHRLGIRARAALTQAREQVAALIHAESAEQIVFTSGGTEAANLAVQGIAWANRHRGRHLVVSAIEHPAVLRSVEFLEQVGFSSTRVPVDAKGRVDPAAVRAAITDQTVLVCVHHVNHDVGTIEPIREIGEVTAQAGIAFYVDATASAGWLPIDVQEMGASLLSLTAHRFYGPKGAGALYRGRGVRLARLIHGGDQESGRRAGTENVPAIVGLGIAADIARRELPRRQAHVQELQARLWQRIRAGVPYVILNGPEPGPERIGTSLNVSAEFTEGEGQLLSLDMAGVLVASGTSCVSGSMKLSPVLQAMGVDRALAQAAIIMSLGKDNTAEEIDEAAAAYARVVARLRTMSPGWEDFQAGLGEPVIKRPGGVESNSQAGDPGSGGSDAAPVQNQPSLTRRIS